MLNRRKSLSDEGRPTRSVLSDIHEMRQSDVRFESGRSFGLSYRISPDTDTLAQEIAKSCAFDNSLSLSAMPSLTVMQRDILEVLSGLFHIGEGMGGCLTSGGTESIFLAVKSAVASAEKRGFSSSSIVGPSTAHPAFRKACEVMKVRWIPVPSDAGELVSADDFSEALRSDTIMAVGSAPCYPWGLIDDIEKLASIASARQIPFHVDACIGGMLLPFFEQLGLLSSPWDFRVPGVTSISVDLHKYGYAMRGVSAILYRSRDQYYEQCFAFSDWPGGDYRTPAFLGSKPAAPIVSAWANLECLGRSGFLDATRQAHQGANRIREFVESCRHLYIVGEPVLPILAIGAHERDIFAIGDELRGRGWYTQQQSKPASIHLMVSAGNSACVGEFLEDLELICDLDLPVSAGAPQFYGQSWDGK